MQWWKTKAKVLKILQFFSDIMVAENSVCDDALRKEIRILVKDFSFFHHGINHEEDSRYTWTYILEANKTIN